MHLLSDIYFKHKIFTLTKNSGEPGEIGPAGYDGPLGIRGIPGDVIPVSSHRNKVYEIF